MKQVRLGIIGFGNMGSGHFAYIKKGDCPEITVTAIADINPQRLEYAKEVSEGKVELFDDAYKMLDSGLIDAAVVAVPHYDHPVFARACFERGIHVMVEKPAGVYTKHVREMNEAAEKANVVFGMMFNQRTNHVYRKMKELVESGKYGQIRRTNWLITNWFRPQSYYDSGAWRATWSGEGGGVLMNQCPHQLDLWQWICGMPSRVSAHMHMGKWHDIEVEDDVTAYVEYPNGATGVFITTTGDGMGSNRFEIQMDSAKLVVEDDKLRVWEFETSVPDYMKECTAPFGSIKTHEIAIETDGQNPQHCGVMNAFAAAILRGEPLVASGLEGINGLTLSNAMHLSHWTNSMVELPFDDDLYYNELMKRVATSRRKEGVTAVFADTADTYGSRKK